MNNTINMCYSTGITVNSRYNKISNNQIINCQRAIYIIRHDNDVFDNIIQYSSGPGISIRGSRNSIYNNTITHNKGDGIQLHSHFYDWDVWGVPALNHIFNNNISINSGNGISVAYTNHPPPFEYGANNNEIYKNTISHNNQCGILFEYPSHDNKAYNNSIFANNLYCIKDTGYNNKYYNNSADCTILYVPYFPIKQMYEFERLTPIVIGLISIIVAIIVLQDRFRRIKEISH